MALKSGFFNSVDNDRLYDATDFALYFKDFVQDGFLQTTSGLTNFKADPLGGSRGSALPSVLIHPGKAYYNGLWAHLDEEYTYEVAVQGLSTDFYLIYLCFDTEDIASVQGEPPHRAAYFGDVKGATPVLPEDTVTKKYFAIAKAQDAVALHPIVITDLRNVAPQTFAGVVPTAQSVQRECIKDRAVNTPQLENSAVTYEKIGQDAVREWQIKNGEVKVGKLGPLAVVEANIANNAVSITKIGVGLDAVFDDMGSADTAASNQYTHIANLQITFSDLPINTKAAITATVTVDGDTVAGVASFLDYDVSHTNNHTVAHANHRIHIEKTLVAAKLVYSYSNKATPTTWTGWTDVDDSYTKMDVIKGVTTSWALMGKLDMSIDRNYRFGLYVQPSGESVNVSYARLMATRAPR